MSEITGKVDSLNRLLKEIHDYKVAHPKERLGYSLNYGSLLNAYREGDVGFDECVRLLGQVKSVSELLPANLQGLSKARIQELIDARLRMIESLDAAVGDLRSKQAEYDRAADAVGDVLDTQYRVVIELRRLLEPEITGAAV